MEGQVFSEVVLNNISVLSRRVNSEEMVRRNRITRKMECGSVGVSARMELKGGESRLLFPLFPAPGDWETGRQGTAGTCDVDDYYYYCEFHVVSLAALSVVLLVLVLLAYQSPTRIRRSFRLMSNNFKATAIICYCYRVLEGKFHVKGHISGSLSPTSKRDFIDCASMPGALKACASQSLAM